MVYITLILIIIIVAFVTFHVYLLHTLSVNDTPKNHLRVIRIFYIINTLFLLSSCYMHYDGIPYGTALDKGGPLWLYYIFAVPFWVVLISRMFFLPYLYSIILTIIYIVHLKKNQFPRKETIIFALLLLLSIGGFVCLELEFHAFWNSLKWR